jgi:GTP-binding protein YchF
LIGEQGLLAGLDPLRDAKMLELELILADLATVERRLERLEANIKKANKAEDVSERVLFERLKHALEAEQPLRQLELSEEDKGRLRGYALLSGKPMLLVANLGEADIKQAAAWLERSGLAAFAKASRASRLAVLIDPRWRARAKDAQAFRADLGIAEPGLDRVIRSTYELLGLISFLTAGEDECRAWTIKRGTRAQLAAGAIHSDIERGFIRAQVVAFSDLVAAGSLAACREKGTLRLEGRDYLVQDGDVIEFKFNV